MVSEPPSNAWSCGTGALHDVISNHQAYPQFNDQAVYPPSNFRPPHQQLQSSPYCADFEDNCQPSSQATPSQSDSDVKAQILKLMGEINQKLTQTVTSIIQT